MMPHVSLPSRVVSPAATDWSVNWPQPLPSIPPPIPTSPHPPINTSTSECSHKGYANKPNAFNGVKKKFQKWLHMAKLYIMSNPDRFPTDDSKIYFTWSYMKGDNATGHLADLFMDQHVDKNGILVMWIWGLFVGKLKKQFMPAMLKWQAESDLQKLRQDKGLVEDFFTKLDMLAIQAGYTMRDRISMAPFINMIIHDSVNNEIVEFIERSQPALLDDYDNEKWKVALIRVETALMEINRCKETKLKWFSPYSSFSQNPNMMKPAQSASNSQPCPHVADKKELVS